MSPCLRAGEFPAISFRSLPRAVLKRRTGDFLIIKMKSFAPDDLIILVSFTCNQDQVTFARLRDRVVNGFPAIGDLSLACRSS